MTLVADQPSRVQGFGARLRQLREEAGLTQTALGDLVGVQYQSIARYERGGAHPTWPMIVALADALGVPTDQFRDIELPPANDGKKGARG